MGNAAMALLRSLLCYRCCYHSADKSAHFVCRDNWAHSKQKMTARYVRGKWISPCCGTAKGPWDNTVNTLKHCLNWLFCEVRHARIKVHWLVVDRQQLRCARFTACTQALWRVIIFSIDPFWWIAFISKGGRGWSWGATIKHEKKHT